ARFHAADDVGALATGREGDEDIVGGDQGFDLAGEDVLEAVIVGSGGQNRGVGGEGESGETGTIGTEANDQLGSEMDGVGSAAAIAEEDDLAARAESGRGLFGELADAGD